MFQVPLKLISVLAGIVLVLQGCSGGSGGGSICGLGSGPSVTISGRATFDRVHHNVLGALDYSNITREPVRGAVVEAVCNSVISTTTSDSNGNYSLTVPGNTSNVFIRVKAQMLRTGTPAWNFSVVDNTQAGAVYSMASSLFNSGSESSTLSLHAESGWGGTSYTATRTAAPFAILDSVYKARQKVLAENGNTVFPELKLNWSVNNVPVDGDVSRGQITTSNFDGTQIYLLGAENSDTDEYDEHTIVHEWGHYFEQNFSRADNIGGTHDFGERLDIRVAFGEGFGYAFAGMVLDDPLSYDAGGPGQSDGSGANLDNNGICLNPGWYNECSVWAILYDLYDSSEEPVDTVSLGFTPLYSVLLNEQKNTPALTSLFSFIHELKTNLPGEAAAIDQLVAGPVGNIDSIVDAYGSNQTDTAGSSNVLPVYTNLTAGQTIASLCVTNQFAGYDVENDLENNYNFNKLSSFRFMHLTVPTSKLYTITATKVSGTGNDPEMYLYYRQYGVIARATHVVANTDSMTVSLQSGQHYVLELFDYDVTFGDPPVGDTCYSVVVSN